MANWRGKRGSNGDVGDGEEGTMYVESRNESIKLAGSRRRWSGVTDGDGLAYPKRHLEVLAAPDLHLLVVGADLPEVLPVHGEEAARHGGGPRRQYAARAAATLVLVLKGKKSHIRILF